MIECNHEYPETWNMHDGSGKYFKECINCKMKLIINYDENIGDKVNIPPIPKLKLECEHKVSGSSINCYCLFPMRHSIKSRNIKSQKYVVGFEFKDCEKCNS